MEGQTGPSIVKFVNAANYQSSSAVPVAARGSIVAIFGTNLSNGTASAAAFPIPTQLSGTQVLFQGIAAPLLSVSPTQINAQVPFELPNLSSVTVVVQSAGGSSSLQVTLLAQDPAVFSAWKAGVQVSASNPIAAGDTITIYASGLGPVTPALPSGQPGPITPLAVAAIAPLVQIGGIAATVDFAGMAPGEVVYQINVTAPLDLPAPTTTISIASGVIPAVVGPPGQPGINWQGTWNSGTSYAVTDAVLWNGSSYISIQAGANNQPDTSPSFWTLLAQAGANGMAGPTGPAGPAGRDRQE